MSKITGLVTAKGREKQVKAFLDGEHAFTLLAETALKEGLRVGQELSESQVVALTGKDRYQRCFNAAIRYLGVRPRSEAEIKERLRQHGYRSDCIARTLVRLKEQGLVDDTAFARFWQENRETFSPRGRRLTKLELRRKGLSPDIIEQVIGEVDESDSAYRAALSKARRLSPTDFPDFRRRLGEYLARRGFGYDVINRTVEKVWEELTELKTQSSKVKTIT